MTDAAPDAQTILRSLLAPEQFEVIRLTPDSAALITFVPTGETRAISITAGTGEDADTYAIEVPITTPQPLALSSDLACLFRVVMPNGVPPEPAWPIRDDDEQMVSPACQAWKSSLPTEANFTATAQRLANEAWNPPSDYRCGNCSGQGAYFDGAFAGETCPICHGTGSKPAVNSLRFINELTGEKRQIEINAAKLIADGQLSCEIVVHDRNGNTRNESSEATLKIHFGRFAEQILREMGIDPSHSTYIHPEFGPQNYTDELYDTSILIQRWGLTLASDPEYDRDAPNVEQLIKGIQRVLTCGRSRMASPPDTLSFRPLRELDEAISDLVTAANAQGYSIDLGLSCIETGQWGPTVYAVDNQSGGEIWLSDAYTWPIAIEDAWLQLRTSSQPD